MRAHIARRSRLIRLRQGVPLEAGTVLPDISKARETSYTESVQGSYQSTHFSTLPSDNDLTPTRNEEVPDIIKVIRSLAASKQARKTEETWNTFLQDDKEKGGNALSEEELLACYNLVLWGWSTSTDADSAKRAERVIKSMPLEPNATSYRHMLTCFSRVKQTKSSHAGQEAERCIRRLQSLGETDLMLDYHKAIKACSKTGDSERALWFLQQMTKQQKTSDARPMVNRHVLSTVLLALKKRPQQAEDLLDHMEERFGVKPNQEHYSTVMNAWASAKHGHRVEALLNKMLANGVRSSVATNRILMRAWGGNLDRQELLFRATVDDYLNCPFRKGTTAVGSFGPAVVPDVESLSIVLAAQAQANNPQRAETLLNWITSHPDIRTFLKPNVACFTSIMHAWAKANQPERAERIFRQLVQDGSEPNAMTYTTLIHAWALKGDVKRAKGLWEEMVHEKKIGPTHQSLNVLAMAYANARQPEGAHQALAQAEKEFGIKPDLMSYCTVLRAWTSAKQPDKAREVLRELRCREETENVKLLDIVSYSIVMKGFSDAGRADAADEVFMDMQRNKIRPDAQSFNLVLSAYTKSRHPQHRTRAGERAEELLQVMQDAGIKPDSTTFNLFLHCFATSGHPERAESLLKSMMTIPSIVVDIVSLNTCLHAWSLVGDAERAEQLLHDIASDERSQCTGNSIDPDTQSFSIVLAAWCRTRRGDPSTEHAEHAEALLRHMAKLDDKCTPDTVAYNTVIKAWLNVASEFQSEEAALMCAKRADILFAEMDRDNGTRAKSIRPDRITYASMIRVWQLAGNQERADHLQQQSQLTGASHEGARPSSKARKGRRNNVHAGKAG